MTQPVSGHITVEERFEPHSYVLGNKAYFQAYKSNILQIFSQLLPLTTKCKKKEKKL